MDRCGVYCRVSTELQKDNYSIARQQSDGKTFCINNGYDCELYIDVESGSTISKRKEFSRLILDIEDKKIDKVWVIEFSRLTRNDEEDSFFIKNLFVEYGIELYENGAEIKFNSPEDKLFYSIRSSVAAYERRKIVERMTNGLRKKIDGGARIIPRLYGYDYDGKEVTINESEAEVIKLMFEMASNNKTFITIVRELIVRGCKKRYGGTDWSTGTISKMLRQRAYTGFVKASNGSYIESVYYKPIIDNETWEKTQSILRLKTTQRHQTKSRMGTFELSGLIRCRECGAKYFRKHNVRKGIERGFYIHTTNCERAFECKDELEQTSIDEITLIYLVRAAYLKNFENDEKVFGFYNSEIERLKRENSVVQNDIEELEKNKRKLEADKKKLIDAVINEVFTMDEIKEKKIEIDKQIGFVNQRIEEQNMLMASEKDLDDLLDAFSAEHCDEFSDATQVERKDFYLKHIKKITIYNRELDIEFINKEKYNIPDIYNLDTEWQGRWDMVKAFHEGNFDTED